ncbi:hypothetical protein [Chlorobium sp. N1]|uniref:hypothetical protein n=1 Tax=Chlorobium sp. N1 TaxID=2491138 RepID=UPI001F60248D|nr:hypothetical protein [Chlorobium sp. N1]
MSENLLKKFLLREVEFTPGFVVGDNVPVDLRVNAPFTDSEQLCGFINPYERVVRLLGLTRDGVNLGGDHLKFLVKQPHFLREVVERGCRIHGGTGFTGVLKIFLWLKYRKIFLSTNKK